MFTKKQFQTTYSYCRWRCKWWTSGWHLKDDCKKLVQNIISLHEIDMSSKKSYCDLKFITISKNVKKKSCLKYLRSWNLRSKLYLVSCFYASLLMICFEDLILILYIWVPNLTIEVIIKIINFEQHFATRPLTTKTMAFVYQSTCLVYFTMLAPISNISPPLLSEWTTIGSMFLWLKAAMKVVFVNLCGYSSAPLVNPQPCGWPTKDNLFSCLRFVPYNIPLRGGGGGKFHSATYAESVSQGPFAWWSISFPIWPNKQNKR